MPAPIYSANTGTAAIALSAATAKSVLGAKAHANSALLLKKFKVAFDGVTASAVPVLIDVCYATWATNSPGTNSTSASIIQAGGRVLTAGFTMGYGWSAEPTVLTVIESFLLTPNVGVFFYDYPLGDEPDTALGEGFAIRCTAPATVNVRATMAVSRA
jgi:hypothetical protein